MPYSVMVNTPDPPVVFDTPRAPNDESAAIERNAEVDTESDGREVAGSHIGVSRYPSWLPEDQRYLKGAAVGPSDSMLADNVAGHIRNARGLPPRASMDAAGDTSLTIPTWDDAHPRIQDAGTLMIGTNGPTPDPFEATAHLVEEQSSKVYVASPYNAMQQCLPDTATPGGRLLCFGISFLFALSTVTIVLGLGIGLQDKAAPSFPTSSTFVSGPFKEGSQLSSGTPDAAPASIDIPSVTPSKSQSFAPTVSPTGIPSLNPSWSQTGIPSKAPTINLSTQSPSLTPTNNPTSTPPTTQIPTLTPTTNMPTNLPILSGPTSIQPTAEPALQPLTIINANVTILVEFPGTPTQVEIMKFRNASEEFFRQTLYGAYDTTFLSLNITYFVDQEAPGVGWETRFLADVAFSIVPSTKDVKLVILNANYTFFIIEQVIPIGAYFHYTTGMEMDILVNRMMQK